MSVLLKAFALVATFVLFYGVAQAFLGPSLILGTGTVAMSSTIPCDQGPNTTAPTTATQAGTDVIAAGFSKCALNAAFTDNSGTTVSGGWVMNNPNTWLDSCGTFATGAWRFYLEWGSHYHAGDSNGAVTCNTRGILTTDSGTNIFQLTFLPGDIVQTDTVRGLRFRWPACGDNCNANGPFLPPEMYAEITQRFAGSSLTQGTTAIIWNIEQAPPSGTSTPNGFMDYNVVEVLPNNSAGSAASIDDYPARSDNIFPLCCGGPTIKQSQLDLGNYHTFSYLITSDESTAINQCWYIDGALIIPDINFSFGSTKANCYQAKPLVGETAPPPNVPTGDNKWTDGGSQRFNDFVGSLPPGDTLTNSIVQDIKSIRIFECPTYKQSFTQNGTSQHHCPGTLVFHTIPPA